ncbi:D-alanyl-D-alanine carboxypeptidase [Streptomyces fumigatiscleroticus]|nr:D-alanyl-D-alanine carboxypeptidase [Streptomyces fumigatiscleroticus]
MRRMEEASVAGESPDRSKQRESSAEPTSGSAGPVPEAGNETGGRTDDPRLSVAREKSPAPAEPAPPRGGVDTATRVFSVRDLASNTKNTEGDAGKGAKDAGKGPQDGPADLGAGEDGAAESGGDEGTAGEDAPGTSGKRGPAGVPEDGRLRQTVAAWVASADGKAADGDGADEDSADDEDGTSEAAAADATDAAEDADTADDGADDGADDDAPEDGKKDRNSEDDKGDKSEKSEKNGEDEKSGAADEPRVDQPTAVFTTVRPRSSSPAVDQPTTMLKLGDTAKAAEKGTRAADDEKDGEKTGRPEAEAERTSKFVALKPLDDPSTRRPKPADATAAPPKVPPADATASVPQVGPERTTQQPLPPKPPLDLLAELTNTPPPPPTPLRTVVRRVKIWTPLVLLLVVVFAVVQAVRPLPTPTLQLTADADYTFEGGKVGIPWPSDGQAALDVQGIGSFGSSGEQKPVPIASVAKVMTAYLILRDHPLKSGADGPKIRIDAAAEKQGRDAGQESAVKVYEGDSISQREALEAILIASANNVARLLARWDAGSEKAFVTKMNDAAKDLGMTNTTYTDPSGLNNTTVSTAVDQVKLAKQAMKEPAFREVAAMMSYTDYKDVNHSNWNTLVGSNNVVGIKTGTTTSALGNLVFAAKKEVGGETRTIIGAVVRQPAGGGYSGILDAAIGAGDKLIRAAQGALESATIVKKGDVVGYVDDGLGGRTPVVATQDVKAVGWSGLTVKLTFTGQDLPHAAQAGTEVGTLTVGDGGTSGAVQVPVALQKDLVEPGFADKLTRLG